MNSCIHAGLRWLTNSGIQNESGGVSRYYRADAQKYENISTGITGYYISALLRTHESADGMPAPQALRAGHFLVEHAFDATAEMFPFELGDSGNPPPPLAYFFDSGIIIRALLDLWKAASDRTYLDCAERCGLALCSRMTTVDGSFFPLYDVPIGHPHSGSGRWSLEAGVYQLKVGLAFLELAEATGLGQFKSSMQSLLKWSLIRQEGFLPGEEDPQLLMDRLHAYCYFLEGLLPEAALDPECSRTLQFGILRVENYIEELRSEFIRCDVIAQLLRLRLYADIFGVMELDLGRADQEATALTEFQIQSTDPKIDGGFSFARRHGELVQHINPIAAIFAIQALQMWEQAEAGTFRKPWQALI